MPVEGFPVDMVSASFGTLVEHRGDLGYQHDFSYRCLSCHLPGT